MNPDEEAKEVSRIWIISSRSLDDAREAFQQSFGVNLTTKSGRSQIQRELAALFETAASEAKFTFEIPARLGLALYLGPGGQGRGKGDRSMSRRRRRALHTDIPIALEWKTKLVAKGIPAGEAEREAAEKIAEAHLVLGYDRNPSVDRIIRLMEEAAAKVN